MGSIGTGEAPPVAVEVVRGGIVEAVHRAHIAVVAPDGTLTHAAGDPAALTFPRSSLKPVFATTMAGLGFQPGDDRSTALSASSHSGEPMHVEVAERILADAGLTADDLANAPDWPFDEQARVAWIASGGAKTRIHANCSGKHAAMLATCVANGWPTAGYLAPDHPLQQAITADVARTCGADPAAYSIDGCGALVWSVPLVGLARAFSAIAQAPAGEPGHTVAEAMRNRPEYIGGSRREVTTLLRAVPGLIAKDGADCVYAAALPDGTAVAIKVEDGSARVRPAVIAGTLAAMGVPAADLAAVRDWEEVTGGGQRVGEYRSVVSLRAV
jgi:L-asparaginase II